MLNFSTLHLSVSLYYDVTLDFELLLSDFSVKYISPYIHLCQTV